MTDSPVFGGRLLRVLCRQHGNPMGEIVDSSIGAFYRCEFPMSAPGFWGNDLKAERDLEGHRVRPVPTTVLYLIEQEGREDIVPPPWVARAPAGWCRECGQARPLDPAELLAAVSARRAGGSPEMLA